MEIMKAKLSQMEKKKMIMIILVSLMTAMMTTWLRLKVHSQSDTIQMEMKVMTIKAVAVTGQPTKQFARSSIIQAQAGSLEFGKPSSELDSDANPHNLVELVIHDSFLDLCIEATNEHAAEDASFIKEIGII